MEQNFTTFVLSCPPKTLKLFSKFSFMLIILWMQLMTFKYWLYTVTWHFIVCYILLCMLGRWSYVQNKRFELSWVVTISNARHSSILNLTQRLYKTFATRCLAHPVCALSWINLEETRGCSLCVVFMSHHEISVTGLNNDVVSRLDLRCRLGRIVRPSNRVNTLCLI